MIVFAPNDGLLKSDDLLAIWSALQEYDEQVGRVGICFVGKGVIRDSYRPFLGRAYEQRGLETETVFNRLFKNVFNLRRRLGVAVENEIAALEDGSHVTESELGNQLTQFHHFHLVMACQID